MKTKSIYVAAVALGLMATGCNDDQLVQVQGPASEGHQVRVTASMGADSRLAVTDTGMRLEFTWEDDDVFHVFDPINNQTTVFVKEADDSTEASAYGTFVGTPDIAYREGDNLYAVFNKQNSELQLDADGNVLLDISNQTGKLDERFQYMFAEATYSETEETGFPFRHLVTMMKLNITVPSDVEMLKEIHFSCSNLPTQATLVLTKAPYDSFELFKPGDLVSCYDYNNASREPLEITGEFIPVDGVVTVYFYVFPVKEYYTNCDWYNRPYVEPAVWMEDDQQNQYLGVTAFDSKDIEAGKTYQLNTEVVKMEPFANEATATGSADSPYEIATAGQLYTFMLRTSKGMYNSDGWSYTNCYYKLTSDIQLNNEISWKPTELYSATFDGQGHTISGNITMQSDYETGLFRLVENTTIQNLNLDLNFTFLNEWNEEWFGTLVGNAWNSKIINCVNHSDVSGYFYRMGGLVGQARYNTQIIACGNTGTLTSLADNRQMGGIVSEIQGDNALVEACYNTGLFNVHTMYWEILEVGGIAGRMNSNDRNQVQNCWSNATLSIENVSYDDHITDAVHNIFFGGIVGYQEYGTISNSYWNESVEFVTGYQGGTVNGGGTFADAIPTGAQIDALNAALLAAGSPYAFDEEGQPVDNAKDVGSTSGPDLPIGGIY